MVLSQHFQLLLRQIHSVEDVVTGATVGINPRAPAKYIELFTTYAHTDSNMLLV